MRISLLEKREDFYKLLSQTLERWNPPTIRPKHDSTTFLTNKYLNFIAHPDLPVSAFSNLKKEYSTTDKYWKSLIQKLYVKLAINYCFRKILAHKTVLLPEHFSDYLILGGNHRLRLFGSNLKSSYIVIKKGESLTFIENEIKVRKSYKLAYAPKMISNGFNWLEEEYISGTPLNRIRSAPHKQIIINSLITTHTDNLLIPSKKILPATVYVHEKQNDLSSKLLSDQLVLKPEIKQTILDTFNRLVNKVTDENVIVGWTHGDFQQGNILVDNNNCFKVIDWEAAERRFWLYDFFVLLGEIRSHGDLAIAFNTFLKHKELLPGHESFSNDFEILLIIEELCFSVNEDCSPNYYISGEKTLRLCKQINNHLQV